MKFIIFSILGSLFLGGCTGSDDDTSTDSGAPSEAVAR
jgi:hypothetical protein